MTQITEVDRQKDAAEILIKYANGDSFTIDTKGREIAGRGVQKRYDCGWYEVTTKKLDSLQKSFDVRCDF